MQKSEGLVYLTWTTLARFNRDMTDRPARLVNHLFPKEDLQRFRRYFGKPSKVDLYLSIRCQLKCPNALRLLEDKSASDWTDKHSKVLIDLIERNGGSRRT